MQAFMSSAAFSLHFLLFGLVSTVSILVLSSTLSIFRLFLGVGLNLLAFFGLVLATDGDIGLSSLRDLGELLGVPPGLPPNLNFKRNHYIKIHSPNWKALNGTHSTRLTYAKTSSFSSLLPGFR